MQRCAPGMIILESKRILSLGLCGFFTVVSIPFSYSAELKSATEPTDMVLVFDTSGSMDEMVPGGHKMDVGKAAMWKFIDLLPNSYNIGLVAFSNENDCGTKTLQDVKRSTPKNRQELKKAISSLRAYGNTPIGDAIRRATGMLANSTHKKRIVVLTDGEETCSEATLGPITDEAWKQGVKIYAIGFGLDGKGSRNFRRMGIYKDAGSDQQLASVFKDIRKSLERDSSKFDEGKNDPALAETPPVSFKGRTGHFQSSGSDRTGKLYKTLQLTSSFEHRFDERDHFTVLEHGYHVIFNEQEFTVDKVEVLRIRMEEKLNFIYGGVEGFVFVNDVAME